jgi:hypothetical protein
MSLPDDVRAAAAEIEKYLVNGPEVVDPHTEALRIAQLAVAAAKPRIFMQMQTENEQLKHALEAALTGGCCPKCGQLLQLR